MKIFLNQIIYLFAKGPVVKLAPPHAQSAWGFRGERVRVARLAACYNYFSKKKKGLPQLPILNEE